MTAKRFAVILPARFDSTRFPGKPLARIAGRPLIEWVYRRAEKVEGKGVVIVATEHPKIAEAVREFGGNVVMTSPEHRTGTDRVAEVAEKLEYDVVVNLQGDEPIVPNGLVESMVSLVEGAADTDIATACHPAINPDDLNNPNVVKVVMDINGRALYFSRSPIPGGELQSPHGGSRGSGTAYRHIGIYAFRRESLLAFAGMGPSTLEKSEGLEQLRALENGMKIKLVVSDKSTVGVNVPEDIKIIERLLLKK